MKILVAGGAGYVGSVLVPTLLERGYEVAVVDLCWFGNHLPDRVPVTRRDVFDLTERDLRGFDQVVFLAGLSNDPMAEFDTRANFHHNTAVPINLCYHAKRAGVVRFIYASSCSVYGYVEGHASTEDQQPCCDYPYGQSKYFGERGVLSYASSEFSVIALRKGTISGPSPRMRFDLIVNTMFRAASTKGVVTVDRPGLWRPILDIRSAVSAYVRAIEAESALSGVFNAADGNYTVGQVADAVAAEMHGVGVEIKEGDIEKRGASLAALRNYIADTTRAQNALGWIPRTDGIGGIVRRLMARDYGDMFDPRYSNIETWKALQGGPQRLSA